MSKVKHYRVSHNWNDSCEVTIAADLDILTVERAVEINNFWSEADHRMAATKGDAQKAVIRLFGQRAINTIASEGGADFASRSEAGAIWTDQLLSAEGWGGYEWCGLRVTKAEVSSTDFDDLIVVEVV